MLQSISYDEYAKIDANNFSTIKEMENSPLDYLYTLKNPKEDTTALACGRAAHTALFEPDRFLLDYVVWTEGDRRGNEWKKFKEQHKKKTILKEDEYMECLRIRDAVRKHDVAKKYLERGLAEQTITWTDKKTGLPCKARLDFISRCIRAYLDLKTSNNTNLRLFSALVERLNYHAQLAFYTDGLAAIGEVMPPLFIIVKNREPYPVVVADLDDDTLQLGRSRYQGWLRGIAKCRENGHWPGPYGDVQQTIRAPKWAFYDESDEDVESMDLVIPGGA